MKQKEVFLKDGKNNNNLFQFFHRFHGSWDSNACSKHYFQTMQISSFSHYLVEAVWKIWGRIWRNWERFLLKKKLIYKNLSHLLHIYYHLRVKCVTWRPMFTIYCFQNYEVFEIRFLNLNFWKVLDIKWVLLQLVKFWIWYCDASDKDKMNG